MDLVTIIIPTYNNRSRYLKRILGYYASYNEKKPFIIVSDASDVEKSYDAFDGFNNGIRFMQFPATINPFHKFIESIREVRTKYVLFCADDDFITLNGIKESVKFLEENPEYSCARGIQVSFRIENDESDKKRVSWRYTAYGKSIVSDQAEKRLVEHLGNYDATFYSVHRTLDLLTFLDETMKVADDCRFGELIPSILTAIHGKIKILDIFYGAREESSISTGQSGYDWPDVMVANNYRRKYKQIKICLSRHLQTQSSLSMGSLERVVEEGLQIFFSQMVGKVASACVKYRLYPSFYSDLLMLFRKYSIFYPFRYFLRIFIKKQNHVPVLAEENKRILNDFLDSSPDNRHELLKIEKFILDSLCQK